MQNERESTLYTYNIHPATKTYVWRYYYLYVLELICPGENSYYQSLSPNVNRREIHKCPHPLQGAAAV